ncbi:hypothetical protein LB467_15250 [Salegentibacter sp. JZCK2]|uniref:hypothetical protein n=1 Tax=Salegentibacter tibetensis TaxID=2873600 RepID=UPI001CCE6E70|nr:hypothetical protein [Salegentibacter tibetensis]MBZ9731050.1 hypothetical protein [Salegentibacter tibetensis]
MKTIAVNIKESVFKESKKLSAGLQKSTEIYINEAIQYYNLHQNREILRKRLKEESLNVLQDFEEIDYEN